MKRLVLLGLFAFILAGHAVSSVRLAPVDAVTIGPRHGQGPSRAWQTVSFSEDASQTIRGLPMATIPRAHDSAKDQLERAIGEWLRPTGLPADWQPPTAVVDRIVQWGPVEEIPRDYGTVYVQEVRLDTSDTARHRLVEAFEREEAGHRLVRLGGLLAFVLACLAVLNGYIRADEATRGYYTNQLRLAAAAGVGATGYVLYRLLA